MHRGGARSEGDRGFALPLVIWTLALLAAIALGMTAESRSDLAIARNLTDAAQAEAAADGGIWRAVARMADPDGAAAWRPDGSAHGTAVGAIPVEIAVQDEGGKIDLNKADPQLIANLLRALGIGGSAADSLMAKVMAARAHGDDGSKPRLLAPADIPGLLADGAALQRLRPCVTVYSGQAGFDPATAPAGVLLSLPSVQPAEVAAYVRMRGDAPPGIGVLDGFPSLLAAAPFFTWAATQTMTITARTRWDRASFTRVAVVDFNGGRDQPYDVLAWRNAP